MLFNDFLRRVGAGADMGAGIGVTVYYGCKSVSGLKKAYDIGLFKSLQFILANLEHPKEAVAAAIVGTLAAASAGAVIGGVMESAVVVAENLPIQTSRFVI